MKNIRFLTFVLTITTLILSACGAAVSTATPATESVSQNADAMPVAFVGIVDSMVGDQWVISGNTVTVDESIVRYHDGEEITLSGDEYFFVGDNVDRSLDSRLNGPSSDSSLMGVADLRFWPLDRIEFLRQ